MIPASGGQLKESLAAAYHEAFKERQILLRSDSGTRCLNLSSRVQVGAAVLASGLAVWGLVASSAFLWQAGWNAQLAVACRNRPTATPRRKTRSRSSRLR